ncbi:ABC transporter ATP-binding protein [Halorarius halobius]|uniref:ABC transporter ATP-binding protein n=1 Tax=Halorarius halobius TaxID=2962671 RepID=UPI0020CE1A99|nr:ABC transporter ATP-binding protein [Halorarius halobius]
MSTDSDGGGFFDDEGADDAETADDTETADESATDIDQQETTRQTEPTGSREVLTAEGLRVSYGQVTALRGIDLHVEENEIVGLIGPNGAGKTTFANTVSGFIDYDGSASYRGQEVADVGQTELVEQGMIHCTEERDLFGFMSVEENLKLGAYRRAEDVIEERLDFVYDLFPRLVERRTQNARTMSGGEQQMLAIGRALMGDPDLLILDEPTIGLAPVILEDISDGIEQIMEEDPITILLTEQNVTFAFKHADRMYLLENGEVELQGTPDELRGDDYIRESYLGG